MGSLRTRNTLIIYGSERPRKNKILYFKFKFFLKLEFNVEYLKWIVFILLSLTREKLVYLRSPHKECLSKFYDHRNQGFMVFFLKKVIIQYRKLNNVKIHRKNIGQNLMLHSLSKTNF